MGPVVVTTGMRSLPDLLGMARIDLDLKLDVPETPASELQLSIAPADGSGYSLQAKGTLAGMTIELSAGNSESWELPAQSRTHIEQLIPGDVSALLDGLDRDLDDRDVEAWLASAVPRYELPTHQGRLTIAEIPIDDESLDDTEFTLVTGPSGYRMASSNPSERLRKPG